MTKRLTLFLLFFAALPALLERSWGQQSVITGSLTASAASCQPSSNPTACVFLTIDPKTNTVGVEVSGTFSGTLQFVGMVNATLVSVQATPNTGGSAVTSTTSTGTWTIPAAGYSYIGVRCSTYSSGAATVSLNPSQAVIAGSGSGAGGAVSSVSNVDGTLTISPTTGAVVGSLNLAQPNTWSALQTFGTNISIGGVTATGATGTGLNVFNNSPTLVTPALGTPSAIVLTNATGFPAAVVQNNQANTFTAAGTLDLSACTVANCLKIPVGLGLTSGANGAIAYDSNNNNTHIRTNGADSLAAAEAAAITNNVIPKSGSSTNSLLTSSSMTDNGSAVVTTEQYKGGTGGTAGFVDAGAGYNTAAMSAQSTATCTNVTSMTWNIAANKRYILSCEIPVTFAASATLQFCLGGPGTATSYSLEDDGPIGASAAYFQGTLLAQTVYSGTSKTTASGAPGAVTEWVHVKGSIQNGATASGTALTLQTAGNGTNNITVLADATCVLTQQN